MNASEAKKLLLELDLNNLIGQSSYNAQLYMRVYMNTYAVRQTVDALGVIESLEQLVDLLKSSPLFTKDADSNGVLRLEADIGQTVDSLLDDLYVRARFLLDFLIDALPEEKEDSIHIKLPPAKDFSDMARVMNEFNQAISIPINDFDTGGQVVIESAESGSIWLWVYLGSKKAMRVVGELCWSAAVITNKLREAEFVNQQVAEYKITNDYRDGLMNAQQKLINIYIESEAIGIRSRLDGKDSTVDNESQQRLMNAISTLGDLFHKGAEIRPSLTTKEDVANLFPKSGLQHLIESKTKQLPQGDKPADIK